MTIGLPVLRKPLPEPSFQFGDMDSMLHAFTTWFKNDILVTSMQIQILVCCFIFFFAWSLTPFIRRAVTGVAEKSRKKLKNKSLKARIKIATVESRHFMRPVIWLSLQWTFASMLGAMLYDTTLLKLIAAVILAWIIIRFARYLIKDPEMGRLLSTTAWIIAVLNIMGLLRPTMNILDEIGFDAGEVRVSVLTAIKLILLLGFFMWLAFFLSKFLERRLKKLPSLVPSVQVLLVKAFKTTAIILAFVGALTSVGIDLTIFAYFTGALGIGIGFGLQKIISNLVSGIILLLDRSVKPGDVIRIEQTYGWIESLNARYIVLVTRDGTEHLIPNEQWITSPVENWSHSNNLHRLRIPLGVSYSTDVPKAIELCIEAAKSTSRVINYPEVTCLLTGFGDSSVNLEIRAWILDPQNGRTNLRSDIMLNVWKLFHKNNIQIPFPQRDLHIKSFPEDIEVDSLLSNKDRKAKLAEEEKNIVKDKDTKTANNQDKTKN